MENNDMGGAYNNYGRGRGEVPTRFGGETWGKGTTWKTQA